MNSDGNFEDIEKKIALQLGVNFANLIFVSKNNGLDAALVNNSAQLPVLFL
jgi:hypothetical protein